MKTNVRRRVAFLIVLTGTYLLPLCSQSVNPDDPSGAIKAQLLLLIRSQFGEDYKAAFSVLDSAIIRNQTTHDGGELTDPYGTLRGCILFGADKGDSSDSEHGIMGIYKDGQIVWHSDPIFKGEWYGIHSITDINRDGKVELLVEWTPGMQLILVSHLWVITWDGSTGAIINQVNPTTGNTTIHAGESMFDIIEIDTVSPLMIRGHWPSDEDFSKWFPNTQIETLPYVTYSWNGSLYGLWSDTRQIRGNEYLPANRLSVSVNCAVTSLQDSLSFQYSWSNSPSSRQRMKSFALAGVKKSFFPLDLENWRFWGWWQDLPIAGWEIIGLDQFKLSLAPGKSQAGMMIHAQGPPAIVKFYIQGFRPSPDFGLDNPDFKPSFQNDFFNNSFIGYTLGPVDSPSPFVPLDFLDTLSNYTVQSRSLGWIRGQATAGKYLGYFTSAKIGLQQNNVSSARSTLQQVLQDVNADSTSNLTSEAYALIRYNTEYLLAQLPTAPPPGLTVKLVNSTGTNLTGGSLQYYDGSWKDAVNNNDGTFRVNTTLATVSLRMTYEGGSQTKSNVTVGVDTVVFQTVNTLVKLQNSVGIPIDIGTVQYYFSAWKDLGATTNGVAAKELLPGNYTFRMIYAAATNDKQQDIGTNPTVVFSAVNATVQLKNSLGEFVDQGTVQYYFSSWQNLGTTTDGVATKELLPGNYTFRMAYASATNDKQQNIGINPTVVFSTVNAAVQLKNSLGEFIDQGTVQYYFSSWQSLGTTSSGVATKELLPANYTFRMAYASATNDKEQNIGTNATVVFQTVNTAVQLQNSQGALIDTGTVQYYFSSWQNFGTTTSGVATKELLPANYTFRMSYASATKDKQQNVGTNPTVVFNSVNAIVQLKNSLGAFIDQGTVQYYFSSWKTLGSTTNGVAVKELLPGSYTFRMSYETVTNDKVQDISANSTVSFSTVLCTVRVRNSQSQPVDGALISYYFSSWRQIGTTVNGEVTKELLPANLTFRMNLGTTQQDKAQNIGTNALVEFSVQ